MRRVLIVGNPEVCEVVAAVLETEDYHTVIGSDAHASPDGEPPLLVLATMPAVGVDHAIDSAQRADGVPVLPVVFGRAPRPGCLSAPFGLDELLATVRRALGER